MLVANKDGDIVLINHFAEQLFGYGNKELLGMNIGVLLPDHLRAAHNNHRKDFMTQPETRTMGRGRELLAKRKDGSQFPLEISLSCFKSDEGLFVVAFILDLTERKKALNQIILEQKLAQTYFELAPVLFVVGDESGNVISVNEYGSQLLGYSKDDMVGKHFTNFLADGGKIDADKRYTGLIDGTNRNSQHESIVRTSQGKEIEIGWKSVIIKDEAGVPVRMLSAGIDITKRKMRERQIAFHHAAIQNLNDALELSF